MAKPLLFPACVDNNAETTNTPPADLPTPPAEPPAETTPAATPAAAATVLDETAKLKRERDELATRLKNRETEHSTLEKQFQDYKATVEAGQQIPVKVKRRGPLGVRYNDE